MEKTHHWFLAGLACIVALILAYAAMSGVGDYVHAKGFAIGVSSAFESEVQWFFSRVLGGVVLYVLLRIMQGAIARKLRGSSVTPVASPAAVSVRPAIHSFWRMVGHWFFGFCVLLLLLFVAAVVEYLTKGSISRIQGEIDGWGMLIVLWALILGILILLVWCAVEYGPSAYKYCGVIIRARNRSICVARPGPPPSSLAAAPLNSPPSRSGPPPA